MKQKPFNNPFTGLKLEAPKRQAPPARARHQDPKPEVPQDEAALFRSSVGAVEPLNPGPARLTPKRSPEAALRGVVDPELEALTELAALVAGEQDIDLANSDEYIEGSVPGLDRQLMKRLRAGEFAVQAHVDLHGLTKPEAKAELAKFIEESRRRGHRCVLVVHGRGLHSKDQIPVLKQSMLVWLGRGQVGRKVLAFTTARPHDGGAGAVYVLLRR